MAKEEISMEMLMSAAGRYLHQKEVYTIDAIRLQNFICDTLNFRPELQKCRNALVFLEAGQFIELISSDDNKFIYKIPGQDLKVKSGPIFQKEGIGNTLPLWSNGLGIVG